MPKGQATLLLHRLRGAVLARDGELTDAQLMGCFLQRHDEAAFEALLRRHGPMVLSVCRRVLGNAPDAEDAFQAAFLVFLRKAPSIASREAVGGWLYRVAYRAALEARARRACRHAKEKPVEDMPQPTADPDDGWREFLPLLDAELNRLPEKYRVPVVLCELEGRSRREAARQLGIPEGTLSSRLAQARKRLAKGLSRHGVVLSAAAVAAALAESAAAASVPPPLLISTAKAAAGHVLEAGAFPARVVALTEGVMKAMLLSKLKAAWTIVLAVVVSAAAVGMTYRAVAQQPKAGKAVLGAANKAPAAKPAREAPDDLESLRLEMDALRKEVRALRERVKSLEAQERGQKVPDKGQSSTRNLFMGNELSQERGLKVPDKGQGQKPVDKGQGQKPPDKGQGLDKGKERALGDALAEAEAALKRLRQNPKDKQATEALEQALRQLREQPLPNLPGGRREE